MAKLNDLIVTIGAQTRQFDKALGASMRKMQNFGKSTKRLGKSMTMGLTAPIAALGFTAVKAFDEQAKAIAQVEAGLKSTGNSVGFTSQQLQQMSADLQTKTIFGDEEILKDATSQLLTFTNIAGDQFTRTQKVALDLATRLDGDLKSASIQLGKALNDPIANLTALSRSGIQFSKDQKEVIKSLTESGRLAEAQTVILDELEKQYGGSAEAAAKAGTGGLKQLANSFGDLQEEFGKIIVEFMPPIIDGFKSLLEVLKNLSPESKELAVQIAAVSAAIGPLLFIVPSLIGGLEGVANAFSFLNKTMLTNPFAIVATGIALVVTGLIVLNSKTLETATAVEKLAQANKDLTLEEQKRNVEKSIADQQALVNLLKAEKEAKDKLAQKFGGKAIAEQKAANQAFEDANAELGKMQGMLADIDTGLQNMGNTANDTEETVTELTTSSGELSNTLGFLINQLEEVPNENIWQPINNGAKDLMQTLGGLFNMLEETPVQGFTRELSTGENIMNALASAATTFGTIIGTVFADMINGAKSAKAGLIEMAKGVIAAALAASQASIIEAMINSGKFTGPAAPIVIPALIAGGVAMVQGLFAGIPAFADGGIVSGPTMAMVGEYSGAANNPEVIAPLDKLQSMMGGQAVQVTGKISGRDILLTSERNAIDRNRVRGF